MKNALTVITALAAGCAAAPEIEKTSAVQEEIVVSINDIAQRKALAALFPEQINPQEGRQFNGSFVTCEPIEKSALAEGEAAAREKIAAEVCARTARVFCTGAPSITEQQVGSVIGAGRVRTDCVSKTDAGVRYGHLQCNAETGVYDEADGWGAAACVEIEFVHD